MMLKRRTAHLFRVELVQLGFAVVLAPEAEHLRLGTVGHVDELLVPPPVADGAADAAQDQAVVAYLWQAT